MVEISTRCFRITCAVGKRWRKKKCLSSGNGADPGRRSINKR
jgi:hypothetical protein